MSSKPLVSVIVIFLNTEKFIEEAIESVLDQTYDNWELLLVDDGSTDGSTQIALYYAEQYPKKVRYLEHPNHQNRGMSAARNLGISRAKGEYIAFLDADDVWLPYKLEQQVGILNSHPEAGMVYGNTQYWCGWTGKPEDIRRDFVPELGIRTNALFKPPTLLTLLYPLGKGISPSVSNIMVRREVVGRTDGFEESFRGGYTDQVFYVKVYLKESVFVASECWDRYRQHPDSCLSITRRTSQHHTARLFFLNWLEKYLSEQGVEDTEVWRRLREEQLIAQVRAHAPKREWMQAMRDFMMLVRHHPRAFVYACQRLRSHLRLWRSSR
jgi:glycosyltransferase involved in cell wall biosynthesis